ncbi:MAG: purine-binding chemotaxis protein CheW [Deltaproteobacteria bacterium]|nr:purine-binding chemotaxis protein CheW [Deltaproteobacteria bacterium]
MMEIGERTDRIKNTMTNKGGKYLTFNLASEEYGLEILKVQEIIGVIEVTRVPQTPKFVRGVINLRGQVIPVIDLRLKFGMEAVEDTERTCIIVVQIDRDGQQVTTGVIVDDVSEVVDFRNEQIAPPPEFGGDVQIEYILGMGKINKKVVMLLDIDKVLSAREMEAMDRVSQIQ